MPYRTAPSAVDPFTVYHREIRPLIRLLMKPAPLSHYYYIYICEKSQQLYENIVLKRKNRHIRRYMPAQRSKLRKSSRVEIVVYAALCHQLVVRALLDNVLVIEHKDRVGVLYSAQSVRNCEGRASL